MAPVEIEMKKVSNEFHDLLSLAAAGNISGLIEALQSIVPEFVPRYQFEVAPPASFQRVRPDLFPPQKLAFVRNLRVAAPKGDSAA